MLTLFGDPISFNVAAAAVSLILFCLLGAFDGFYFHLVKYQLHKHPESRLEHTIHSVRGALFIPIALIFFAFNAGGWLLAAGIMLLEVDLVLEIIDIFVEKKAREKLGGLSSAESVLHVLATSFRMAVLAFIFAMKPASAFDLSGPLVLEPAYPLAFRLIGFAFAAGAVLGTFAPRILGAPPAVSREGLAWSEYKKSHLLLAVPAAIVMDVAVRILRRFVKAEVVRVPEGLPRNAIVYTYHRDALMTLTTDYLQTTRGGAYLGFHGFLSYFPTFPLFRRGVKAIRYDRSSPLRPMEQLKSALESHEGPLLVRTDSGKPYGRVRASLVELSLATGRPLIALAQRGTRTVSLFEHCVPLPGCTVVVTASRPVYPEELAMLGKDEGRELLQRLIDGLDAPAAATPALQLAHSSSCRITGRGAAV